ncbi:hypothetical protein ACSEPQ_07130 [Pseudomonas aeruginosa]
MNIWEWEKLEESLEELFLSIENSAILPENISSFSLKRNEEHKLVLTTHSVTGRKPEEIILGRVYKNENKVSLQSPRGEGLLRGVSHLRTETDYLDHSSAATKTTYEIQSIEFKNKTERITTYTIDYIANLPGHFIWPNGYTDEITHTNTRSYMGNPSVDLRTIESKKHHVRDCLRLRIDEIEIVIGRSKTGRNGVERPGYILYTGQTDITYRRKIQDCLSYAFGTPLVHFGHSSHCKDGHITELAAISPNTVNGRAWSIPSTPPAPITDGRGSTNILNEALFQRVVKGLFDNIESYNLDRLPWRLWHADTSPYFMRPAYYGALVEGLQKKYIQDTKNKISSTIIEKCEYRKIRPTLLKLLNKQGLDQKSKDLLLDKINSGNTAPQKIIAQKFYSKLNLTMGDLEISAWNKRNDAAHGNEISEDDQIKFIRETKALKVMLNRIILRITNGSDDYIDYFTYNHPSRPLNEAIPIEKESPSN